MENKFSDLNNECVNIGQVTLCPTTAHGKELARIINNKLKDKRDYKLELQELMTEIKKE